jgi:hypothetical protein
MTRISFWHPAENHERFAPHAFDGVIGSQVPVGGQAREDLGLCTVVAAEVAGDGSRVLLTIEVPESYGPVTSQAGGAGGMSFAFTDPDPDLVPRDPVTVKPPRIKWRA